MPGGLVALLDDIAALAKLAGASLDDVAGAAGRAGTKAAGVVIDDTAVTPRYVTGLSPDRELPIIGKIALGSLRNKLLFLLPAALLLSAFAPWAITPILMVGGAYSYAQVPAGFVVQDWLHLARNPYDRVGHFAQGFVPAIVVRELLVRGGGIARGRLLAVLVLACCLAINAAYELIEFAAAMGLGQGADAFLGTQGDPWDTQWDMLTCLIGAAAALLLLTRVHDAQIARRGSWTAVYDQSRAARRQRS